MSFWLLTCLFLLLYGWRAYQQGKRTGSRLGYQVGRYRRLSRD